MNIVKIGLSIGQGTDSSIYSWLLNTQLKVKKIFQISDRKPGLQMSKERKLLCPKELEEHIKGKRTLAWTLKYEFYLNKI
jgi:hypothetical protein